MIERTRPTDLSVVRIGIVAARALTEGANGRVIAVFERSLYVSMQGQCACIGPEGLGDGPLNVICDNAAVAVALCNLSVGDAARIANGALLLGGLPAMSFANVAMWRPSATGAWSATTLTEGLSALNAALPPALPQEGLALLLRPDDTIALPHVAGAARAPARQLANMARDRSAQPGAIDIDLLTPLLGLGPGLTPSGDDFLGGALIALNLLALTPLRDTLWQTLLPIAATATGDISRAHLAAAAEGFGSGALHALLDDVMTGRAETVTARLAAVAAIGHTSGWDALAGAVAVLDAANSVVGNSLAESIAAR